MPFINRHTLESTQYFSIGNPQLTQIDSIHGYGRLNINETGIVQWFIIQWSFNL